MTESQVIGILGQPQDKEFVDPFEVWYYQQPPQRTDARVTWRPKHGFVRFKKVPLNGQDVFLLLDWKLPLWREVATMPIEVNLPAVPVEQTQPVESEIKQVAKTEPNLPPPPPVEPAPAPTPQPQTQTSWQDLPTTALNWLKSIPRIWLIIGGGIAAFIIYAILKPDPSYRQPKKGKNGGHQKP